jgi:thiol-disulfide isomerase/thioredoxin
MTTPPKPSAGAPRLRGGPGWWRLLTALACTALLAGCSTGSDAVDVNNGGEFRFVQGTPSGEVIPEGERASAPDFGGELLGSGNLFESAQLDGQIGVLNFWGSWCAPCRVETPEFSEVAADLADDGVQFVGINVKETDEQFATAFVDRFQIHFPSLYDPRGEVALAFRDYPANAIPSTIVLDPQGRVAAVYTGTVSQEDLRTVLDRLREEGRAGG